LIARLYLETEDFGQIHASYILHKKREGILIGAKKYWWVININLIFNISGK
jgi:hypothetical protein